MNFQDNRQLGKDCRKHNQIIHFDNGKRLTLLSVVKVWQDTLVHLVTEDGREFLVNPDRVLHTELEWILLKQSKK